jgi:hypothetical protein
MYVCMYVYTHTHSACTKDSEHIHVPKQVWLKYKDVQKSAAEQIHSVDHCLSANNSPVTGSKHAGAYELILFRWAFFLAL